MSDIIRLLPDSVANQIAAGEVIQRPASIIKELVENALDAGATLIQVVVEDAGKSLVQVIDNGCGMSETDARLSFERHATSKIQQAADLFALRTMGFRGEALASIAAVAQVELRTRMANNELGTCIHIEGSKVTGQEPVNCPVGANFAVRNLFFNIPARRKFLKSNQTELSNILAEFERIALAHPEIAFKLYSDQNLMLDLPEGNFRKRIMGIFGKKIDSQLIPIHTETSIVKIKGYVAMPTATRRKNAHQYLFVNGRFMRHPYFSKAIQTAYERLIPEGQQIPYFVKFDVEPNRIDVNIHPTKTEIKFEDDNAIFQILLAAVREALGKYGAVPAIDFDVEGCPDIPSLSPSFNADAIAPPTIHINNDFNPFEHEADTDSMTMQSYQSHSSQQPHSYTYPSAISNNKQNVDWQSVYNEALQSAPESEQTNIHDTQTLFSHLPIGEQAIWNECGESDFIQYQGRYIITPLKSGIAIIDQHRAHNRILYERYLQQINNHKVPSQRLLFPETINLSPSESAEFEALIPNFYEAGFDISNVEANSYSIQAVPVGTEGIHPTQLVLSIFEDTRNGQGQATTTIEQIIAQTLSRKVAMPIGQALSIQEMNALTQQLFTCQTPNFTPTGQPTLVVMDPTNLF